MTLIEDRNRALFAGWCAWSCVALIIVAMPCVVGCEVKSDPRLAQHRSSLALPTKPDAISSIEEIKKSLSEQPSLVTIEGVADLESLPSSQPPKALMLVRELPPDQHGQQAGHDPSSCPFCKRQMARAPKAAVEFVDGDGRVIPYPVEKLFGLRHGERVVVTGMAQLDPKLDVMKVTASGIYVGDGL